jgi:cytochrome d ubiquinol oxidase subunit I
VDPLMVEQLPDYWDQLPFLRKLLIAESWETHILLATLLLGTATIAPLTELLGLAYKQPYYEKFAKGLALVNVVIYSIGAVLAISAVFVTLGFFPKFFSLLFLQFFWLLIGEEITFLGQLYIVLLYYFLWNKMQGRAKPLHILLGLSWIPMAIAQQSQIISFQGFALTPNPPVPYFNPGFIPQVDHRFMGNFSWAGFALAALAGFQYIRYARQNDRANMAFWDWAGSMGIVFGVLFLVFFMPLSGYSWVIGIKGTSSSSFYRMMIGEQAWIWQLQMFFIGLVLVISGLYMWRRLEQAGRNPKWTSRFTLSMGFFWLLGSIPYYIGPSANDLWVPWTIPLGAMRPWKYIALSGLSLFGLAALLAYVQGARDGLNWGQAGRAAPRALITTGLIAVSVMVIMGVIRESARLPGQIYGEMNYESEIIPQGIYPMEDVHRPKLGPLQGP